MVQHSARGSVIILVGQVLSAVFLAVGSIIVARLLGDFSYGVLTLATIPISVVTLLSDIGVNSSMVKFIAQYRSEGKQGNIKDIVKAGLILNLTVTGILSLGTILLSGPLAEIFHAPSIQVLIEICALGMFAHNIMTACQSIFIGFERMEYHSLTVTAYALSKAILAPILVVLGYGVFGATAAGSASYIFLAAISMLIVFFISLRRGESKNIVDVSFNPFKVILGFGIPIYLSNIISGGLNQLFNFLMAVYVEISTIGNYQAAMNFSILLGFLSIPINTVLFPLFSKLNLEEGSPLKFVFQSSVKYSSLILIPSTMGLMALSQNVIRIIYGDSYALSPFFLQLILLNTLFVGIGSLSVGSLVNSQGKTRVSFISNLIYLCIGFPLGLFMIPNYGVVGLLLTSIFASKPGLVYMLWWIKRNFGFSVNWASSAKIFLSSGLSFLFVYLLLSFVSFGDWFDTIIGVGIFFIIYCALLPSVGAIDENDIGNLRIIIGALGPLAPFFNMFLAVISKLTKDAKNHDSETASRT